MKIIHLIDRYGTCGGVNSVVNDLANAQRRMGEEVYIIAIVSKTTDKPDKYTVCLGAPHRKKAFPKYLPALRKAIKNIAGNEETVVSLNLKLSVLMGGLATLGMKNVRCVEMYHSKYSGYTLQHYLFRTRIKKYIAISESAAEEMKRRFHVPERKLRIINNGIDNEGIYKQFGTERENTDAPLKILSVGRISEQKNYETAVEIFDGMSPDDVRYTVFGGGAELKGLKEKAGACVEFKGRQSREESMNAMAHADLFLIPSLWEGLSISLLEAMSLGCPLMVSNIASFHKTLEVEPLKTGEHWRVCDWGYLVETNEPQAYRQAIEHFRLHPEIREGMSRCVLEKVKRYGIDAACMKYIDTYKTLF